MRRGPATAKLNLAMVVGPRREDGMHEVATVLQRVDLADRVALEPAAALSVEGFDDTIVRGALESLAAAAGVSPRWRVRLTKRIPASAGLGGGSSDAATALRLANATLPEPLRRDGSTSSPRPRAPTFRSSSSRGPSWRVGTVRRCGRWRCRRTTGSCSCSRAGP